jgi:hypothetical protein
MDHNWGKLEKKIVPARCRNTVRKTHMISLRRDIFDYSVLPHSVTSSVASNWSMHSPLYLERVKGCWQHLWKASPKVRETSGC